MKNSHRCPATLRLQQEGHTGRNVRLHRNKIPCSPSTCGSPAVTASRRWDKHWPKIFWPWRPCTIGKQIQPPPRVVGTGVSFRHPRHSGDTRKLLLPLKLCFTLYPLTQNSLSPWALGFSSRRRGTQPSPTQLMAACPWAPGRGAGDCSHTCAVVVVPQA